MHLTRMVRWAIGATINAALQCDTRTREAGTCCLGMHEGEGGGRKIVRVDLKWVLRNCAACAMMWG